MMDEKYNVFFTATSHDAILAMVTRFGGTATMIDMQGNRASSTMWIDDNGDEKPIVFYGPMITTTKYRIELADTVCIIECETRKDIMRVHGLEYTPL